MAVGAIIGTGVQFFGVGSCSFVVSLRILVCDMLAAGEMKEERLANARYIGS